MRSLVRNIILSSVGSTKSIGCGIHILNSHYISKNDSDASVFHDLLNNINKTADFVTIQEAVKLIQNKQKINDKLIAFTFDDGFAECHSKIAPVLSDFNTNAAFFINPGFVDGDDKYIENFNKNVVHVDKKPMNWEQIKELHNQGFVIGNHTYDHVRLVGLSQSELEYQIRLSKSKIEEKLNSSCDYFAWTYGSYNDIDDNALKIVAQEHKYNFSCDNYTKYFWNNQNFLNRRHIEGDWPLSHIKYFLSKGKEY